jgi:uncharacterized protein YjdB
MKNKLLTQILLVALLIMALVSCDKNVSVTGVTLNKTSLTLGVGQSETLISTILPAKANNQAVTYTSSNPLVASVMPNGLVTALSKGTTTIVVYTVDGGFSATCAVTVKEIPVSHVLLNKYKLVLDITETEMLISDVQPANATNKEVYWTSSNHAVATVNFATGLITPMSVGNASITVTTLDGSKTAKCDVEIIKKVFVTGVTLDKSALTLDIGNTHTLIATVLPANATNKNVS